MQNKNIVEFKVWGKYALFTDPITKIGGEKYSYQIPTYEALKGILSSVYWKPTIIWVIDKVRVMKPSKRKPAVSRPIKYHTNSNDPQSIPTFQNVEYHFQAHFVWNVNGKFGCRSKREISITLLPNRKIERGGGGWFFLERGMPWICWTVYFRRRPGILWQLSRWTIHRDEGLQCLIPDEGKEGEFLGTLLASKMIKGVVEFYLQR